MHFQAVGVTAFVLFCSFRRTQSPHLGWSEPSFITRPSSHIPLCVVFHVPPPVLHPVWPNQCMPSSRSPLLGPPVLLGGPGSVGGRPGSELGTLSTTEPQSLGPGIAPSLRDQSHTKGALQAVSIFPWPLQAFQLT